MLDLRDSFDAHDFKETGRLDLSKKKEFSLKDDKTYIDPFAL